MKRVFVVLIVTSLLIALFGKQQLLAQNVNDNIYIKENIPGKKPVPFPVLREADMMWTKKIWQIIDCREKMNHHLYFPFVDVDDRKSLISLLIYGINNEGLTVYTDDDFKQIMTRDEVYDKFDALPDTQQVTDPETGEMTTTVIPGEIKYEQVTKDEIKEQWYFDKQHSVMNVRIIGLCPVRLYTKDDNPSLLKKQVMWIYYPEVRALLTNHEIYNRYNEAQRISFDDYLMQRRFTGFVWAESNVYDDRWINEYTAGIQTLLEAERIDNELFRLEHDMWVY